MDISVDADEDGEPSVSLKISLTEAMQEAIRSGTQIEGAKLVDFGFDEGKLVISIDTNLDGQPLLSLAVNLVESFDEISDMVRGSDA